MTFASLSGGRDSGAMVVKWLESGEKLDYVLFCDTGFEFEEMYAYIDKLDNYLQKRFNISITRLDSRAVIERWGFCEPITRGERAKALDCVNQTFREKSLKEYEHDFKYRQDTLLSNDYADDEICFL